MADLALQRPPRMMFGVKLTTLAWFVMFLVTLDTWMTVRLIDAQAGRELTSLKILLSGACLMWVQRRASDQHGRVAMLVALTIYLPLAAVHLANNQHMLGRLF